MSIEIIHSIKQTEAQADKIIKEALEDERAIVSEANKQAYVIIEQAIEEAEKEAADIIMQAEINAKAEAEKIKLNVSDEDSVILQQAREKLKSAVDIIIERIVTIHGDS